MPVASMSASSAGAKSGKKEAGRRDANLFQGGTTGKVKPLAGAMDGTASDKAAKADKDSGKTSVGAFSKVTETVNQLGSRLSTVMLAKSTNSNSDDSGVQRSTTATTRLSTANTDGNYVDVAKWDSLRLAPESRLQKFVSHMLFTGFVNLMIGVNLVQMGLACDNTTDGWKDVWWIADNWFTAIFLVEMVLKIGAWKLLYFTDKWNVFDAGIVLLSVADTWVLSIVLSGQDKSFNMGPVRMFRMLRLLRMVKMFRMIPELMMVIYGIAASLKSLFWVFGLLTLILYVFAILCVQVIGGSDAGYPGYDSNEAKLKSDYSTWNNHMHFGSIPRAFVSLINMILLAEWPTIVWPVWEYQGLAVLIFVALLILTTFGVMNVIIGVIVERTNQAMEDIKDAQRQSEREQQMETIQNLVNLLVELDEDHSGDLTVEEMDKAFQENGEFNHLVRNVDLPKGFTIQDLHRMLDKDADGTVTQEEFVDAMYRIVHGNDFQHNCMLHANFADVKMMIKEVMKQQREDSEKLKEIEVAVRRQVDQVATDVLEQLQAVKEQMAQLATGLKPNWQTLPVQLLEEPTTPGHAVAQSSAHIDKESSASNVSPELRLQQFPMRPVEAKEEKMPAVKSSAPGVLMPCLTIGRCSPMCDPCVNNDDTRQLVQEAVQREVNQASADVKLEIKALRNQLLTVPAVAASSSHLSQQPKFLQLPSMSESGSPPIHTAVEITLPSADDLRREKPGCPMLNSAA